MISPWNLRAPASRCLRCGNPFADREKLFSRLLFSPAAGYSRQDFCASCWPSRDDTPLSAPSPSSVSPPSGRGDVASGDKEEYTQSLLPAPAVQISDWSTTFRAPPPPSPEPLARETAETLLRRLLDTPDPSQAPVVFVLAVMLERRRILVERAVHAPPDGPKIRVYEHRRTGETLLVPDPGVKLSDIPALQSQVISLLSPDAPPSPPSPPSP